MLGRTNYEGFHSVWPAMTRDERTDPCTRDVGRLDLVDDLRLAIVPVLVGGGLRLFPDGVAARFRTGAVTVLEHGAVGLHLRRG